MCLFWWSPTAWSPGSTSGDFIFNLAIAHSGKLEIGTRQLNNWRLHVSPDFLPFCQPGALSTRLHCSRMPRHHTRPPGRYNFLIVIQVWNLTFAEGRTPLDSIPTCINWWGSNSLGLNTKTYQLPRFEHPCYKYQHVSIAMGRTPSESIPTR